MSPQPPAWLADLSVPISLGKTVTAAEELARAIKSRWLGGETPDAEAAFREHPELLENRSVALELAYEEYCQRTETGEHVDTEAYCDRFSALRLSLAKQLAVHVHLQQYSEALELPVAHWPQVGESVLGFTLIEELGRGGFARVYLAREAALGDRPVVVKITQHPSSEAQVLGRLRHRNVVPVYSVHHDPGTSKSAVCMPYLGRATLFELLDTAFAGAAPPNRAGVILEVARQRSQPHTPDDGWHHADSFLYRAAYVDGVVHLIAQVAEALHYTHSQGICHGDLKPSNILLGWDGTPLLLDFNLSFDHHVADSALGGTIPYMSPEQLRGTCLGCRREGPVDVRADLFSLAVILYELLTGKEPFGRVSWKGSARQTAEQLLEQQQKGPRSLHGANPRVDHKLARVVERCLAVDPDSRLESAEELAVALRRALTPSRRARRWIVRHRHLTVAAAVAILLVGLTTVGYVATLPPRSEQALHAALAAAAQSNPEEVIERCTRAIELDPNCGEAFFLRGYAYQMQSKWGKAFYDFESAEEQLGDGSAAASAAYCACELKQWFDARRLSETALKAGVQSAALLNNYGQLLALSDSQEAKKYLLLATKANPQLHIAFHNLAVLELRLAANEGSDPAVAWTYMQRALDVHHPNARVLLDAARICNELAAKGALTQNWIDQGIDYLQRAMDEGLQELPQTDFRQLQTDPRFDPLLNRPAGAPISLPSRFVDPIDQSPANCWQCGFAGN